MQSTSRRPSSSDWVSIGRAADLLGVNPATLRQWTTLGKLHAYRTPGGHRRFSATELASLAAPHGDPVPVRLSPESAPAPRDVVADLMERLRQRYHGVAQSAASHEGWIARLDDAARLRFHQLGESLLTQLSAYVTANSSRPRRSALQSARDIGEQYGRLCSTAGLDTAHAVEAYVVFRRPVLEVLGRLLAAHPERSAELSRVMRDAETFLDAVLASVVSSPTPARPSGSVERSA